MYSYSREVNYYETDKMGVIHHSNYLKLFEEARFAQFKDTGYPYPDMEKQGIIIPCTETKETYIGFLRYGDTFRIDMVMYKFTGLRMCYRYKVYNETTGELCHEAESVHYTTTREDYKPTSIKHTFPEAFEHIKSMVEDPSDLD